MQETPPELRQAKQEIQRLHEELERRVIERTHELAATNKALRAEIAERKRAEEALRASEERFRRYFELGLIGMAITSPTRGILELNDHLCEILGYERSELLQMTWAELTHPDDLAADVAKFTRVLAGEFDGYSMDKRFLRKDGQVIHATISVKCLRRADGSVDYFVALLQDITERKRLEEQLRQTQKFEALGRLAGGIAHDFNNLLTAFLGYSEILLRQVGPTHPLRRGIETIQRASESAASLTQQLLAFSRRQVLQPRVLDLNAVITEMSELLQRTLGEDMRLVLRPEPGLHAVRTDRGQIERVVLNLSMNARDAMPRGGLVVIETQNVSRRAAARVGEFDVPPGDYVALSVTDTGGGIDAETSSHVFEPFFTTKPPGHGTGLGLATVYGIIKQSGGFIEIQSAVGRGTRVTISLPASESTAASAATPPRVTERPRGAAMILLVEDDDVIRTLASAMLTEHGYAVLPAKTGEEALALVEGNRRRVALLLTDVVLPGISGRELRDRVRAIRSDVACLFISGYPDDTLLRHGLEAHGTAFLPKPFAPDTLLEKIRDTLEAPGTRPSSDEGD